MASPFDDSDDKGDFLGFSREEVEMFHQTRKDFDYGDKVSIEEEMEDEESSEESDEIQWNESPENVETPEFTEHVGPVRRMPLNSSVLDYVLPVYSGPVRNYHQQQQQLHG